MTSLPHVLALRVVYARPRYVQKQQACDNSDADAAAHREREAFEKHIDAFLELMQKERSVKVCK